MTFLPIANSPNKPTPIGADKLVGTDSADGSTKNFTVAALAGAMATQGPAGGVAPAPVTVTANATATTAQRTILVDATAATRTITLYTAVGNAGKEVRVKKIAGANAVTIAAAASETIDGAATVVLAGLNDSYTIESNGTSWFIV